MAVALPHLTPAEFRRRLLRAAPEGLADPAIASLFRYYQELDRWGRRQSLIGPGTAEEVVERHFAESLAALPLLPGAPARLVDLGSGAGFPGAVIAAARPDLQVWLIESRARKVAFLRHATARASLVCRCLNVRVGASLPDDFPENIDVFTLRAVRLDPPSWDRLAGALAPRGHLLVWGGPEPPEELKAWPPGRRVRLPGERRWIVELSAPPRE